MFNISTEKQMQIKQYGWYISENERLALLKIIKDYIFYHSFEPDDEILNEIYTLVPELDNLPDVKR